MNVGCEGATIKPNCLGKNAAGIHIDRDQAIYLDGKTFAIWWWPVNTTRTEVDFVYVLHLAAPYTVYYYCRALNCLHLFVAEEL